MASKNIYVYADWSGLKGPSLIGTLRAESIRGNEIFSFEYDNSWLNSDQLFVLDPDMNYYSGPQYLPDDKPNFGVFLDSSPDRWGRVLMRRREALLARMENRPQKSLMQSDYLLGVYDEHRMGALRFKESPDGPFLNDNREMAAPPWTSLRELEYASLQLEKDDSVEDPDYLKWLNLLMAPGSSLGGARPKASVLDKNNHLWIAKFPSRNDDVDVGGWEMVVHDLAVNSGINMPEATVQKFSGNQYTYISNRFDRQPGNQRIHFASAMTMLGRKDGDNYSGGQSYLDIAGFIIQSGDKNHVDSDLHELWKRIAFNICVKNTDDHLRNHGFLLGKNGWRLSPAFDINPVPTGTGLTLNISDEDNSLDLDLALEVADFFRLETATAKETIDNIKRNIKNWRKIATQYGLSKREQDLMSAAFEQQ
ncbi:MAG: HipA domain-containing protein [Bacteroidales bacterium]|nr:HipA domain-containing protein [Bacteroidales bacterium]